TSDERALERTSTLYGGQHKNQPDGQVESRVQRGAVATTHLMSAQTSETPRLSAALWYASLGWSVVPVHKVIVSAGGVTACSCPAGADLTSKGQHPAVAFTQH